MQLYCWKTFLAKTEGSISFEAIWAGLFVTFFFAPTAFLFQFSQTHLDASWAQRSAARDEAINGNCNGVFFLPIPIGGQTGVHSITSIDCTKLDGEKNLPASDKFWKKLDSVTNPEFSNFTRDMKDKGDIKVHQGRSTIIHTKGLDLGDVNLLASLKIMAPKQSAILAPSTDYYIFDKAEWKEGHDKRIWDEFSSKHKKLFPEVYPSASTGTGGSSSGGGGGSPPSGSTSTPPPATASTSNALTNSGGTSGGTGNTQVADGGTHQVTGPSKSFNGGGGQSAFRRPSLLDRSTKNNAAVINAQGPTPRVLGAAESQPLTSTSIIQPNVISCTPTPNAQLLHDELLDIYGSQEILDTISENSDYINLATEVYNRDAQKGDNVFEGWTVDNTHNLPNSGLGGNLVATLYKKGDEYVLSYRGTATKGDLATDLATPFTNGTEQTDLAIQLAKHVKRKHPDVTFVGHSMGGRFAKLAAMETGNQAVVVDSAPLSTKESIDYIRSGLNKSNKVIGFRNSGDRVSILSSKDDIEIHTAATIAAGEPTLVAKLFGSATKVLDRATQEIYAGFYNHSSKRLADAARNVKNVESLCRSSNIVPIDKNSVQNIIDELGKDAGSCKLSDAACFLPDEQPTPQVLPKPESSVQKIIDEAILVQTQLVNSPIVPQVKDENVVLDSYDSNEKNIFANQQASIGSISLDKQSYDYMSPTTRDAFRENVSLTEHDSVSEPLVGASKSIFLKIFEYFFPPTAPVVIGADIYEAGKKITDTALISGRTMVELIGNDRRNIEWYHDENLTVSQNADEFMRDFSDGNMLSVGVLNRPPGFKGSDRELVELKIRAYEAEQP